MRKFLFPLLFLIACSPKITDLSNLSANEIIKTDKEMSEMALKIGFNQALLNYADDNVIKPRENQISIFGKKNLSDFWKDKPGPKTLSWVPNKAEASRSGDIGYTFGYYTFKTPDSTFYGNYYTIWKKQSDGKWKFVLDGGNATPKP